MGSRLQKDPQSNWRPFFTDPLLGYDEKRDPFDTGRCSRDLCQHQMHHSVNRIVVPGGNEYLLPPDLIIAFVGRLSRGGDIGKRAPCFGLCQGLGPLPLTGAGTIDQNMDASVSGSKAFACSMATENVAVSPIRYFAKGSSLATIFCSSS